MLFTSHTIQANGLTQHYYRSGGAKPPLLLLHGFTDDGSCWFPIAETLTADYDVIAPDARGHGKSDRITEVGFSNNALAEDAFALIQALGLQRPAVLGHSMGAYTTLILAATHPEVVECALLEDPPFSPAIPETETARKERMHQWANGVRQMQTQTLEELIAAEKQRSPLWSDAELLPWAESKMHVDLNVFAVHPPLPLWRPLMQQVQCPLLLLYGDLTGSMVNETLAEEAATLWKNGQAVQIPRAGHCIHRDNPSDCLAAVRAFLHTHYAH